MDEIKNVKKILHVSGLINCFKYLDLLLCGQQFDLPRTVDVKYYELSRAHIYSM